VIVRSWEGGEGRDLRRAAACGGRRGKKEAMERDTSCSWLHSVMLRSWALVHAPPVERSS
jgi:hypothetical protein